MKVITRGTLIDGTGRDPISNASLIVNDEGRITRAGKLDKLAIDIVRKGYNKQGGFP
ncbi:MAG: hypothetical protein L0177_19540 [Chloroflexi bacterium]|nr:hypothetical protein [Chloroflexota bacterium]